MATKKNTLIEKYKVELDKSESDLMIENLTYRLEDYRDDTDSAINQLERELSTALPKKLRKAKRKVADAKKELERQKVYGPISVPTFESYIESVIAEKKNVDLLEGESAKVEAEISAAKDSLKFYKDIESSISD